VPLLGQTCRGAELADPERLLEGTGKFMRHLKLRPRQDIAATALRNLIETVYMDMKQRLKAESSGMPSDETIDAYISQFPAQVQQALQKVRQTIRSAAPKATEVISYRMPAFRQQGILVYFAAWKHHIGLYPPISGDAALEKAAAKYAGPQGQSAIPAR